MPSPCKRWVFTLNNHTEEEEQSICDSWDDEIYTYLIFGRETGDSGTPHLQGFFILDSKRRLAQVRQLPGLGRAHFEICRGTNEQASLYCKKDGDYYEKGDLPATAGKRTDFDDLKEWYKSLEAPPTNTEIAEQFPSLWGRYKHACLDFLEMFAPKPKLVEGELNEWQQEVNEIVEQEPDDRKIIFVVDPDGNSGKSWLARFWFSTRTDVQLLSIGKRDDLAFAIDDTKSLFVFDIPRGSMEYLQYGVLEQLKNRVIFSPKYTSRNKILKTNCHIIVFSNEAPDMDKLTHDRYHIVNI